MAKWVYLGQRNTRLSRTEFHQRWLNHRRIGTVPEMLEEFVGATYCAVRSEQTQLELLSDEYDGIGLFALKGLYSIPLIAANLKRDYIQADELRFFARTSEQFSIFCQERVIRNQPESKAVITQFLRRSADVSPGEFVQQWQQAHAAKILEQSRWKDSVVRYVQNTVVAPPPPGHGYDGIAEIWFDTVDNMLAAAADINRIMLETLFIDVNNSFFNLTDIIMCRPRVDTKSK